MNKQWIQIALGVTTAIGGVLDAGTVATAGEAGAKFGLDLVWAVLLSTVEVMLTVDMAGRFTAVSEKTYGAALRECFDFKLLLLPLLSEIVAGVCCWTLRSGA